MLARNQLTKAPIARAQASSIKPVVAPLATVFVARSLVQAKASDSNGPTEKGGKKIPHDPVDTYGKGVHEAGASGSDKAPGKGDVADVSERVELLKPSTSKAGVEESAKRNQAKKEERAERFS